MGVGMLLPLLGSVLSSAFAPPQPGPVVIEPPPISPTLTADQATQIAQKSEQVGRDLSNNMLNSLLTKAKAQGVGEKEMGSIKDQFNTWFAANQDEINKSMQLKAAHAQAQADYQNTIQNNAFNTQLAALNASRPQGGLNFGSMLGGLGGMFGGGGGDMGGFSSPYMAPPNMISGPDFPSYMA